MKPSTVDREALVRKFVGDLKGEPAQLAEHWFRALEAMYADKRRAYHTFGHVADLLRRFDSLLCFTEVSTTLVAVPDEARRAVELALFFHDAFYCIPSKDNETQSAWLFDAFTKSVGSGIWPSVRRGAYDAIRATRHDGEKVTDLVAKIVVDLDLSGLADPWDEFRATSDDVMAEYAAVYPMRDVRIGRAQWIRGFLKKPRIYHEFDKLEGLARANLERHAEELEAL